jgi:hypothetical protein
MKAVVILTERRRAGAGMVDDLYGVVDFLTPPVGIASRFMSIGMPFHNELL